MLRLIHSLGRLSVRGYLILAGLAIVSILATYSNLQNERQLAAERAHQQAIQRQQTLAVNLQSASSAGTTPATTNSSANDTPARALSGTTKSTALPSQSNAVAKAQTQAGALVFTPASIALSLSRGLPAVTVSSSDGTRITTPEVTSGVLGLTAQNPSSSPSPSWHMQFSGQPAPGTYQLTLRATSVSTAGVTTEYTGTLTVVVIL